MATKWYYKLKGKTLGPVSSSDLIKKIKARQILPMTQVRKDDSQWVVAQSVTGLFEKAGVWTGEHKCPYCGNTIATPPTDCENCHRKIEKNAYENQDTHFKKTVSSKLDK